MKYSIGFVVLPEFQEDVNIEGLDEAQSSLVLDQQRTPLVVSEDRVVKAVKAIREGEADLPFFIVPVEEEAEDFLERCYEMDY